MVKGQAMAMAYGENNSKAICDLSNARAHSSVSLGGLLLAFYHQAHFCLTLLCSWQDMNIQIQYNPDKGPL